MATLKLLQEEGEGRVHTGVASQISDASALCWSSPSRG